MLDFEQRTKMRLTSAKIGLLLALVSASAHAQILSSFGGQREALYYAYGMPGGPPALQISAGNTATGSSTITLVTGNLALLGGTNVYPISTTAPITVGIAGDMETVTPTAVSGCNL